ncbi:ribonuclease M5 [Fructilactobacillus lindneri]|uniref:Ribonuclease M5 n=1 Tax=Fructilactobacillus lindneri TaxID=53444 RepID=A0AB33BES5_9LACO|nr:ribonuclease M5 [Fructilactobacillus lindneri]ANZ57352.1 ribonuclease M5 [Fructilactobacillus lindneri]ANZ58617.1 ribonuclease M5 [Fructilactobacillus lindneri]POG97655.1 ribonuclease M5 [Fructilactobacillus lindneri]POG98992.1 ribonuclease M5 [Fructilactobacillus lindneri]POG99313.1 ribonuclease M5 [Fructilactobacillus lindneri]
MKRIKEVLVVEGKSDTERIQRAVDADTIETRGSAISDETLALIDQLAQTRGVIVFTDPDFSGEKIRRIIADEIPEAKHAFLNKHDAVPDTPRGSLGVEHASPQAIREALKEVYTESDTNPEIITKQELIDANLVGSHDAKERRLKLGELLHLGYVNAKQLQRRLRMFGITKAEFNDALSKIDEER